MFRRILFAILVALLGIALTPYAHGQGGTATITGVVKDQSGAVVPEASVTATQSDTNFHSTIKAGKSGEFSLTNLPIGPYRLAVTKSGFSVYDQTGIVLEVGQSASFQIVLNVGSTTQTVEVTAGASMVEATDNTLQTTVPDKEVVELPLNGRNAAALVTTIAGTTSATLNGTPPTSAFIAQDAGLASEVAIQVNGVRAGGTYFDLDGADNVDPYSVVGGPFPNPDATQEFRVATGSETARYPSAPGGAVDIVSRSGTNSIHGSAFKFARNGFFNAENDLLAQPDNLNRHQFGGAIGGPILKDRWFIFGNYQRTDTTSTNIGSAYVPTALERTGVFTSTVTNQTITLPVNPTAAAILAYIPLANNPNGLLTYGDPIVTAGNQWTIKTDLTLGQHRIFARNFADHNSQPATGAVAGNYFARNGGYTHNWDSIAGGDTWISKNAKWMAETRVSHIGVTSNNFSPASDSTFAASSFGINGVTSQTNLPGFLAESTFMFDVLNNVTDFPRTSFDASEDLLYTIGKHQVSFGVIYRHMTENEMNTTCRNACFIFAGVNSLINPSIGPLNDNTNADFILGEPFVFLQQDGYLEAPSGNQLGGYIEDKYRATDRLTAIAGFRLDPYFPYTQEANHISCFLPGEQSTVFPREPLKNAPILMPFA